MTLSHEMLAAATELDRHAQSVALHAVSEMTPGSALVTAAFCCIGVASVASHGSPDNLSGELV